MKTICPTDSYCITIPEDVVYKSDDIVASFFINYDTILLQISTRVTETDTFAISAKRLSERLAREGIANADNCSRITIRCDDSAAAAFMDEEGNE